MKKKQKEAYEKWKKEQGITDNDIDLESRNKAIKQQKKEEKKQWKDVNRTIANIRKEKRTQKSDLLTNRNIKKRLITCPFCGEKIHPKNKHISLASLTISIILLCFFIVPGLIYMIWESSRKQCPECKMPLT